MRTRLFDLPSSRLIDWFAVDKPVTAVAFSPNGDFLATAHAGRLGIYLWANTAQFSAVGLRTVDAPTTTALPGAFPEQQEDGDEEEKDVVVPLGAGMITLSTAARTQWQNLALLDVIKARNKPKEAEKEKVEAPFFLPQLPGLEPKFVAPEELASKDDDGEEGWQLGSVWHDDDDDGAQDVDDDEEKTQQLEPMEEDGEDEEEEDEEDEEKVGGKQGVPKPRGRKRRQVDAGRMAKLQADADTPFRVLLLTGHQARDFGAALAHMQSLGPAAVDIELRTFPESWLGMLLTMFEVLLDSRRSFELVEAYLDLALKIHSEAISKDDELIQKAQAVARAHRTGWERLEDSMQYNMCLLGHFAQMQA